MTNDKPLLLKILLFPFAFIYLLIVNIRNWCFEVGILPSEKFNHTSVITIGNISMGGTGKTPFCEYVVRLLKEQYNVVILSRGYKRKTSGYLVADDNSTADDIGDEPFQMKSKFPGVTVAVDANRRRAIATLLKKSEPKPDVFVLDDAYQHRYVTPDLSILLVDYHNLITNDHIFPIGRLREPLKGKDRANIVVVTKCPRDVKPIELNTLGKEMNLFPYQQLYFTTIDYQELQPVFPAEAPSLKMGDLAEYGVLCVSGIAKPGPFEAEVARQCLVSSHLRFSDHHKFNKRNYSKMMTELEKIVCDERHLVNCEDKRIIITTEKDAMRIKCDPNVPSEVKSIIYFLPLELKFVNNQETFNKNLIDYVDKNKNYVRISEE